MDHFAYRNGEMHIEDVALSAIAAQAGTPVYIYSTAVMTEAYRRFSGAFAGRQATICYAMKANSNLAVIRTLGALGAGADVVSGGEMVRALAAGIPAERIVFSGVGKTRTEMADALNAGIMQFNIESLPELEALSAVATAIGKTADIAIRVNPDVDAATHSKIATGRKEDKFGIDIAEAMSAYARAEALPGINAVSVAVHIGSQLTDLSPFRSAFTRIAALARQLRERGHDIRRLDLGGGLGIAYGNIAPPDVSAYAAIVTESLGNLDCALVFEPGRYLVGPAGVLVTQIVYVKTTAHRRFVIVDAAMNDLMRPALYGALHRIEPVLAPAGALAPADIVGPVCETGDTFATDVPLPDMGAGEFVVIRDTGAYGAVMASEYNSRPLVAEVLVNGGAFSTVRQRETIEQQIARERFADWQHGA